MRQMRQLAYRTRHVLREPPKPRWREPLINGLVALGCIAVLGLTLHLARTSGLTDRARFALNDQMIALTDAMGMRVQEIFTEGRQRTTAAEIVRVLEPYYGQNILSVDISALQKRLESLPWVQHATVTRRLPDQLRTRLVEHRPIALWQTATGPSLIGVGGDIIQVSALSPYRHLPILSGAGAPEAAGELLRLVDSVPSLGRRVSGAELVDGRRWNVFVDGRIEVRLPERDAAAAWARLARLETETALLARAVEAIDLRLPDRVVVRLDEAILKSAAHATRGQPT